jgi:predicted DNA-binding transcriptional regulator AlpA
MKSRRKSTPVKTRAGIANVPPTSVRGDAVSDAASKDECTTVATLGTRGPPHVLEDPLLFLADVERLTRLSGTTIWRRERDGKFPRRHKLGHFAVWFRSEIATFLEALRTDVPSPGPATVNANEARREAARRRRAAA